MNTKSERGAIIIDATLSLSFFMFALITIYSMIHISIAQARIGTALASTAKEISQYSYIYDLTGLREKQANLAAHGGAAESIISDVKNDDINNLFDAFKSISSGVMAIAENPDNTESFLYYLLNQGVEQAKGSITGELARNMMKKHFGSEPDLYLKRLGVENGLAGLKFHETRLFEDGEESDISLNVKYDITVVKLLDIDMKLSFEQCAKTKAWVGAE